MTTRNGKIARLPHAIRVELNRRLQDGEPGKHLVHWLNQSDQVRKILNHEFGGRPISAQNLCEWKAGGYLDWLRHEESRQLVTNLAEHQADLSDDAHGMAISDRYADLLAVELVKLGDQLLADKTAPAERWQCLREILGQLSQLRRDDHRAAHTRIDRERWHRQVETEDAANAERARQKERQNELGSYEAAAELEFRAEGGGISGREVAAHLLELERDLPPGTLNGLVDLLNYTTNAKTNDPDNLVPPGGASVGGASARHAVASGRRPERRPIHASRTSPIGPGAAGPSRAHLPRRSLLEGGSFWFGVRPSGSFG